MSCLESLRPKLFTMGHKQTHIDRTSGPYFEEELKAERVAANYVNMTLFVHGLE